VSTGLKSHTKMRHKAHAKGKKMVVDIIKAHRGVLGVDSVSVQGQAELTKAVHQYLDKLERAELHHTTIFKYKACIRAYRDWLKDEPISQDSAERFIYYLKQQGFKRSTKRSYYHALKPFLAYLGIPLIIRFKKEGKRLPAYHGPEQIIAMLEIAKHRKDKWGKLAERDYLILLTLAHTGLRRAELLSLCLSNINFQARTIRVIGKGDKERTIKINDDLLQPLLKYTKGLKPTERIFPLGPNRLDVLVRKYAHAAGINDFTPHSFRHYFVTQVIKTAETPQGLEEARRLAGHSRIDTTMIYLDIIAEDLTNAVQRLPKLTEGE